MGDMLNKLNESARRMLSFLGPLISFVIDPEIGGVLVSFFEKLKGDKAIEWWNEFKKFLRKSPCWVKENLYLRKIGGGIIPATTGERTLAQAGDIFTGAREARGFVFSQFR